MELRLTGAIIGDVVGSRFEGTNHKGKSFEFFHEDCCPTDDTVMTLAVANGLMKAIDTNENVFDCVQESMRDLGNLYLYCGYGRRFIEWLQSDDPKPYNSYGNGAAMRIGAVPYLSRSLEQVKDYTREVTRITHNHPEGLKGAEAVSVSIWNAIHGASKEEIQKAIQNEYYDLNFTLDEIRDEYVFSASCEKSVPQAIEAFLESVSFEDSIRNAISIGGDTDTIACIAGSIAGAYYGVPDWMAIKALWQLDEPLLSIYLQYMDRF